MKINLQIKLIGIFSFLFIVSFFLISILSFKYSQQLLKELAFHHVECPALKVEQFIKEFISVQKEDIISKSTSIYIRERLEKIIAKRESYNILTNEINIRLRQMVKGDNRIAELFILNTQGEIITSTDMKQIGKNKSGEKYFLKGKKNIAISDIYFTPDLKTPTLLVASPLVSRKDGVVLGVMVERIRLKEMAKFVKGIVSGAITEEIYLVNKNTEFLLGNTLVPVDFKKKLISKGIINCINGKSEVDEYINYRNIPVVGAYRWMDKENWGLIVEIEKKESFAQIYRLRNFIFSLGFIMVIVIIIIVLIIARRISQPILKLAEASNKIASGNLDVSVEIKTGDEIEILARSFNHMVKDLKRSRKELEEWGMSLDIKVKEKTEELQEKVEELEKYNKLSIGRELKMIDLKREIEDLKKKLKES